MHDLNLIVNHDTVKKKRVANVRLNLLSRHHRKWVIGAILWRSQKIHVQKSTWLHGGYLLIQNIGCTLFAKYRLHYEPLFMRDILTDYTGKSIENIENKSMRLS